MDDVNKNIIILRCLQYVKEKQQSKPFCDFLSSDPCDAKYIAAAATETGLRLQLSLIHI